MTIREFQITNKDASNADPIKDREGCRKRGMCDAVHPNGWYDRTNPNIQRGKMEGLPNFVCIRCDLTDAELADIQGLRKKWHDQFGYTVTANRPNQGEYDILVNELNPGLSNQNALTDAKLIRVRDYLLTWGCSNFAAQTNGGSFTFSLWDAVRSSGFWGIPLIGTKVTFALNAYAPVTGVGNITATIIQEAFGPFEKVDPNDPTGETKIPMTQPEIEAKLSGMVLRKIQEMGGTVTATAYPAFTFDLDRAVVIEKFKSDVNRRVQRIFMYQQHRINATVMDQAVAAGGVLTLTKAEFDAALRDMAAE